MAGRRRLRRAAAVLGLVSLAAGLVLLGQAGWIHAKARLAEGLVERAWDRTRTAGGGVFPPWPWADTYPVARLRAPARGVDQVVLAGASGRTLAFGPGHLDASAPPGQAGHAVVAGHRDTHFGFLRHLRSGDLLEVERPDGRRLRYRVEGSQVVDSRSARLAPIVGPPALTLITCYPFDSVDFGGPLRYLVFARALPSRNQRALTEDF